MEMNFDYNYFLKASLVDDLKKLIKNKEKHGIKTIAINIIINSSEEEEALYNFLDVELIDKENNSIDSLTFLTLIISYFDNYNLDDLIEESRKKLKEEKNILYDYIVNESKELKKEFNSISNVVFADDYII